ncbi:hypothetical protein L6R52_22620 [Myxococcota bacterium]|nr:hypothetical protein [Myxococcota bacterium]
MLDDDSVAHQLASDAHPTHALCAELNLPPIPPGNALVVAVGQGGRTCTFHDEERPDEAALRGAIEIVAPRAQPD